MTVSRSTEGTKHLSGDTMNHKAIAKKTTCKDGVTLSIQASRFHYSVPRDDTGPYKMVEVGFVEDKKGKQIKPPRTWRKYSDGDKFPNDVYGYIPVELVVRFIKAHGGVKDGPGIPE